MHRIAVVFAVAACSKGRPDDCAIVRDKPAEAMVEITKRYPRNPVKVAEVIEKCVAPTGDECERLAKIINAIPTLQPELAVPKGDVTQMCRTSPPEFRRCLFPSFALAHADECRDVVARATSAPIDKIKIEPRGPGDGGQACGFVAIYVGSDGTWVATGRDAKARCFAPRKGDALDTEWLEKQLRTAKTVECGPTNAEIAGAGDLRYQDVIHTMDIAIKTGFIDVGLAAPSELSVPLASLAPARKATDCPASVIDREPSAGSGGAPVAPRPTAGSAHLASAPVIIITKDKLSLSIDNKPTEIATVADAAKPGAKLDALTKALSPPKGDGLLILQADQDTPAAVINLVVTTTKAAGYDNLLFAVKNR